MTEFNIPSDPKIAGRVLDAQVQHANKVADMGKIGTFFGSRDNAVVYLAALIVVAAVIGSGFLAYAEPSLRPDVAKGYVALGISALGYMFGSAGRSRSS